MVRLIVRAVNQMATRFSRVALMQQCRAKQLWRCIRSGRLHDHTVQFTPQFPVWFSMQCIYGASTQSQINFRRTHHRSLAHQNVQGQQQDTFTYQVNHLIIFEPHRTFSRLSELHKHKEEVWVIRTASPETWQGTATTIHFAKFLC